MPVVFIILNHLYMIDVNMYGIRSIQFRGAGLAVILMVLAAVACNIFRAPEHHVRVKNNYQDTFYYVKVGPAYFSQVTPGMVTAYQYIDEGTHSVDGSCETGHLEGTLNFEGRGLHRWTVVIAPSRYITLIED